MAKKNSPKRPDTPSKGRRPTTTLDLKATEVAEKKAGDADKSTSGAKTTAPGAIKAKTSVGPEANTKASTEASQKTGATTTAAAINKTSSDAKNTSSDSKLRAGTIPPKKPSSPASPKSTSKKSDDGGSIFRGNFFSGLAGGALALLGTLVIQNLPPGSTDNDTGDGSTSLPSQIISRIDTLEQRLNSLPKNATEKIQPAETALSADIMEKLGKLSGLETGFQDMEIQNAELRARTNTIEKRQDQFTKQDIPDEILNRLRRFEKTISALASTSQNPGQSNVAEIASLVGRINDFETVLDGKIKNLRKSITADLGASPDAPNTATLATIESLKSANQKLAGQIDAFKNQLRQNQNQAAEKIAKVATDTRNLRQKLSAATANIDALGTQLAALKSDTEAREKSLAKTELVKADMTALTNKLAALSGKIDILDRHEKEQRQNASNVLLSLELSDLKHAIDQGQPYAGQLAQIKQLAGNTLGLAALERYKDDKVLSTIELQESFRNMANKILTDIPDDPNATMFSKIMSNAKGIVRIRKTGEVSGNDTEAILARMEAKLKTGNLHAVLNEGKSLPDRARQAAEPWLGQIEARSTIDRTLAALQSRFKSSLAPITNGGVQ